MFQDINLSKLDRNSPICLAFCCDKYLDLGRNWIKAINKFHINNVLIVATNKKAFKELSSIGNQTTLLLPSHSRSDIYFNKPKVTKYFLSLGYDVIFSDIDAIWLKNCEEYFHQEKTLDYDILFSQSFTFPLEAVHKWGFALCSGFYLIRSNPKTIKFISEWRDYQDYFSLCDQKALNYMLMNKIYGWNLKNPLPFPIDSIYEPLTPKHKQILNFITERIKTKPLHKYRLKNLVNFYRSLIENRKAKNELKSIKRVLSDEYISASFNESFNSLKLAILPFKQFRRGCSNPLDSPFMVHIGAGSDVKDKIKRIKANQPMAWHL